LLKKPVLSAGEGAERSKAAKHKFNFIDTAMLELHWKLGEVR